MLIAEFLTPLTSQPDQLSSIRHSSLHLSASPFFLQVTILLILPILTPAHSQFLQQTLIHDLTQLLNEDDSSLLSIGDGFNSDSRELSSEKMIELGIVKS